MKQTIKDIIAKDWLWKRLLYIIMFLIINNFLKGVVLITALGQFAHVLLTGTQHPLVKVFSQGLSNYSYSITRFVTFLSDEKPFPLSNWDNKTHHQ